jgi:phenylalanyl-tRNA synthetase beta chain
VATDAAHRFERGVDPQGQPAALRRVVELITAVAGGTPEPVAADVNLLPFRPTEIQLRPSRIARVLGLTIPAEEVRQLLEPIGFAVRSEGETLRVTVPGFRPDVTGEIDLVEEIARRRGYDSFPEQMQPFRPSSVPTDAAVAVESVVRTLFLRWGFLEARTAGFAPATEARVPLLAPLSSEEGAVWS